MFDSVKKWLHTQPPGSDGKVLSSWAKAHGHTFKTVRDERGGVIECRDLERRWRIEWGNSQRIYIDGAELRMREELGVSPDFQLLLLSRTLTTKLETDVFDRFTEAMQTQIDHTMPEEMRWLAMFPRVSLGDNKPLKVRFNLQSPNAAAAQGWIAGEIGDALLKAAHTFLQADPPFMMMILRGRLYLRMQALKVDEELLDGADALFRMAAARARTVDALVSGPPSTLTGTSTVGASGWDSSASTAWQSQLPSELPAGGPETAPDHKGAVAHHR